MTPQAFWGATPEGTLQEVGWRAGSSYSTRWSFLKILHPLGFPHALTVNSSLEKSSLFL